MKRKGMSHVIRLSSRQMAHLVKKNTTMSVTIAIPRAFSLSLQPHAQTLSACHHVSSSHVAASAMITNGHVRTQCQAMAQALF